MSKKVILAASCVAALALAGGGVYFMMSSAPHGGEEAAPEPPPETLGVIELAPFVTNINDVSGRRHARVEVKLVVSPRERADEIAADALAMARLRDRVLTLITSKSLAELTSPEAKAALRGEILAGAVPIVAPGSVKEALFGELIVQ